MTPRLELRSITKRYPGIVANDDISLSIMPGEIHAVLGENGAGKSTLMKIIYGAVQADAGEILCDGKPIPAHTPAVSRALGIEMVYQHFALFESVTVVENIALSVAGSFDLAGLSRQISELSNRYGMPIDPQRRVHDLSVGERQRVEIVRCLLQTPKLLILDEPTSVLTPQAVQKLFGTLRQLAAEGCSILYISHKLDEVQALCDSATVLRNGRVTGTARPKETSAHELARLMVGTELPEMHMSPAIPGEKPVLSVAALSASPADTYGVDLKDISLSVHGGEIVGLAGVSGNGQSALIEVLSGQRDMSEGQLFIDGQDFVPQRQQMAKYKVFGLPEEPLKNAAVPRMTVAENIAFRSFDEPPIASRFGFMSPKPMRKKARELIAAYRVKTPSTEEPIENLSGGNVQRAILARELSGEVEVLIVANPCFGLDFASVSEIRSQIMDQRNRGAAVLLVSEDLDEVLELSDRVAVMSGGGIHYVVPIAEADRNAIGKAMAGH